MRANIAAALLALAVTTMLTTTATTNADSADDNFLKAVSAQGITGDPAQLIAAGRAACANYGSPALVTQITGLMAQGMSKFQASGLLIAAIRAYCPEKMGGTPAP